MTSNRGAGGSTRRETGLGLHCLQNWHLPSIPWEVACLPRLRLSTRKGADGAGGEEPSPWAVGVKILWFQVNTGSDEAAGQGGAALQELPRISEGAGYRPTTPWALKWWGWRWEVTPGLSLSGIQFPSKEN